MRPILLDDLALAARAVRWLAPPVRHAQLLRWLDQAHWADLYRKRLRKVHPAWGNGSLAGRVLREPLAPRIWPNDAEIAALGTVIAAVREWRQRGFNPTQASPM